MTKLKIALGLAATFTAGIALPHLRRRVTSPSCRGAARIRMPRRRLISRPFKKASGVAMNDESWDGGHRRAARQGAGVVLPPGMSSRSRATNWRVAARKACSRRSITRRSAARPPICRRASISCGVGAILYDFVLGYDKDKLKDAPKGWADFFDVKKYPGKRALRQGPKTTLEIALIADAASRRRTFTRCWPPMRHRARVQEAGHHQERHCLVEGRRPAAAIARLRRSWR